MRAGLDPFSFLVISIAGWMNQRQQQIIEYLVEENRVLREQIGNGRMRSPSATPQHNAQSKESNLNSHTRGVVVLSQWST
jgi:hypothetical protein